MHHAQHHSNKMKGFLVVATVILASSLSTVTPAGVRSNSSSAYHNNEMIESRIIGGTGTKGQEFPFFVQGDGCGGALVAKDLVITTGICISKQKLLWGASKTRHSMM